MQRWLSISAVACLFSAGCIKAAGGRSLSAGTSAIASSTSSATNNATATETGNETATETGAQTPSNIPQLTSISLLTLSTSSATGTDPGVDVNTGKLNADQNIVVNSTLIANSGSQVSAAELLATGTVLDKGAQMITSLGTLAPTVLAAPMEDPLQTLTAPNQTNVPVIASSVLNISSTTTLQPGVYRQGILITDANVTLSPGVYFIWNVFDLNGNTQVTGDGVLIYFTWDGSVSSSGINNIRLNGNSEMTLSPLTSGPYQGYTIFQDRLITQTIVVNGGSRLVSQGAIYAPAAQIDVNGSSTLDATQVICGTLIVNSSTMTLNKDPQ